MHYGSETATIRRPKGKKDYIMDKNPWLFTNVRHPYENMFKIAMRNPYVIASVSTRSNWILRNGFKIKTPDELQENAETKNYIEGLFNNPKGLNKNITYPIFHKQFCPAYILTGNSFIEVIEEKLDEKFLLAGLDYVNYDMLEFDYTRDVFCYRINRDVYYEPEELIHIYNPHPDLKKSKYGFSPVEACLDEIMLMEKLIEYNKELLDNKGLNPRSILSFSPDMDNTTFIQQRDRLKAAKNDVANNGVLVVKGADFHNAGHSIRDMEYISMDHICRDKILTAWRVPPHYAGVVETAHLGAGSGMTQREQMKDTARDDTIVIEAAFNKVLGRYGYHELFEYEEFDTTDYLEEAQIDMGLVQSGIKTVNEVRDQRGDKPMDWGYVPPQLWSMQLQQLQQALSAGNQDMKSARDLDGFREAKTEFVKDLSKRYNNFYGDV